MVFLSHLKIGDAYVMCWTLAVSRQSKCPLMILSLFSLKILIIRFSPPNSHHPMPSQVALKWVQYGLMAIACLITLSSAQSPGDPCYPLSGTGSRDDCGNCHSSSHSCSWCESSSGSDYCYESSYCELISSVTPLWFFLSPPSIKAFSSPPSSLRRTPPLPPPHHRSPPPHMKQT